MLKNLILEMEKEVQGLKLQKEIDEDLVDVDVFAQWVKLEKEICEELVDVGVDVDVFVHHHVFLPLYN